MAERQTACTNIWYVAHIYVYDLYGILNKNDPVYARFTDEENEGHLFVVTGVDTINNIVYTNNPWGKRGEQTFDEFLDGYAKFWWKKDNGQKFDCIYLIK